VANEAAALARDPRIHPGAAEVRDGIDGAFTGVSTHDPHGTRGE